MIPLGFRIIVANYPFPFNDIGKRIFEGMRFLFACWNLPYFDLLHGTIDMIFFDMVNKLCLHIGHSIP